jgi:hypothetical protein
MTRDQERIFNRLEQLYEEQKYIGENGSEYFNYMPEFRKLSQDKYIIISKQIKILNKLLIKLVTKK